MHFGSCDRPSRQMSASGEPACDPLHMSYDIHLMRFINGESSEGGGFSMRKILQPHVTSEEPANGCVAIAYGDGTADLYLSGDSLMANRIDGEQPWDLLVTGARAADWVILLADGPACLTVEAQRGHLPEGMAEDAVFVQNGQDVLDIIRAL